MTAIFVGKRPSQWKYGLPALTRSQSQIIGQIVNAMKCSDSMKSCTIEA